MLFRGFLFAAISLSLLGQVSAGDHEALKRALGLSDSQLQRLQETRVWRLRERLQLERRWLYARALARGVVDAADMPPWRGDLLEDPILDDSQRAKLAMIEKGLDHQAAAEAIVLGLISEQQWPGGRGSLCLYPIPSHVSKPDALELGLSDSQVGQFQQLEQAAHTRPQRDLALAVLDDAQKAKVAAFETALQLASEAIDLALIRDTTKREVLCH